MTSFVKYIKVNMEYYKSKLSVLYTHSS